MYRNNSVRILLFVIIGLLAANVASAHQPRIVFDERHPIEEAVLVEQPEISKAYYGELQGEPDYYKIKSAMPFKLYLNILVPDDSTARTDMSCDVMAGRKTPYTLKGEGFSWSQFYEEFAGDRYLKGPELDTEVGPGTYYIRVYDRHNRGKYSLAVGSTESFPIPEIIKVAFTLPVIKTDFFGKSALSAYTNLIGLFLLIYLIVAVALIFSIYWLVKKWHKRKMERGKNA